MHLHQRGRFFLVQHKLPFTEAAVSLHQRGRFFVVQHRLPFTEAAVILHQKEPSPLVHIDKVPF